MIAEQAITNIYNTVIIRVCQVLHINFLKNFWESEDEKE